MLGDDRHLIQHLLKPREQGGEQRAQLIRPFLLPLDGVAQPVPFPLGLFQGALGAGGQNARLNGHHDVLDFLLDTFQLSLGLRHSGGLGFAEGRQFAHDFIPIDGEAFFREQVALDRLEEQGLDQRP
ncbi:MAG: hypothetical protein KGJ82_03685 [Nitrospirota bacterium]|nr:hypothetical protein [Nitrospirota bacterium]